MKRTPALADALGVVEVLENLLSAAQSEERRIFDVKGARSLSLQKA